MKPVSKIHQQPLTPPARFIKRVFDMLISGTLLLISMPVLLPVIWLLNRRSPGPIFYKSPRMGEGGRTFAMFKFRTMIIGADEDERRFLSPNGEPLPIHKQADDPRITPVGRLLRRASLDEWPQLINVFIGDMSLVGPRPELLWVVDGYAAWQRQRFTVPQGMTGWWQVNNRDKQRQYELRLEDDLYYIRNYSFFFDLRILWLTVGVMVRGDGAY